jgi:flagellum-specific ATP synthase
VASAEHQAAATKLRTLLATHEEVADLIRLGAYQPGSSPQVDTALKLLPAVMKFLRQRVGEYTDYEVTQQALAQIAAAWPF